MSALFSFISTAKIRLLFRFTAILKVRLSPVLLHSASNDLSAFHSQQLVIALSQHP